MVERISVEVVTADRKTLVQGEAIVRTFDAADTKGRQFGAAAYPFTVEYTRQTWQLFDYPGNIERARANNREPGLKFGFRPSAMRGGKSYGASSGDRIFDTATQRDAAIAAYFADAEKRALKNKARAA